ncbi:MAG: hypothetical protein NC121_15775 [Blautia sp.]|nr:hypothetical protein [Blautia sp.]
MDINSASGVAPGTLGMTDIPLGFGFALATNEDAMKSYASLSETEREHLIMRCKDAKSRDEMQKIVDSLVSDADVSAIAQEEREKLS